MKKKMSLEEAMEIAENMVVQRQGGAVYALDLRDCKAIRALLDAVNSANA